MRFLIARQGNVDQAQQALMEWLAWRKQLQLDELVFPPTKGAPLLTPVRGYEFHPDANPNLSLIRAHDQVLLNVSGDLSIEDMSDSGDGDAGPHPMLKPNLIEHYLTWYSNMGGGSFHKRDRLGRPIYIERLGLHDAKKLASIFQGDPTLFFHVLGNEMITHVLLPECNRRRKRELGMSDDEVLDESVVVVDKMVAIFDCKGMGVHQMHLPAIQIIQSFAALDQKYFPEILGKLYIVNAPFMFTSMWSVIKRCLDRGVLDKVEILGSKFQKELKKCVAEADLPKYLGGKCECAHIAGGCCPIPQELLALANEE